MCRTLILSDIHFCKRSSTVSNVEQLRPLWKGYDALILNGDTSELHCAEHSDKARLATKHLAQMTHEDGVDLTLICGNHDPTISNVEHKWYCGKKVLVFHGHAPIYGGAPWSWRYSHFANTFKKQLKVTGDGFTEQLLAVREASIQSATGVFNEHQPSKRKLLGLAIPAIFKILLCWKRYPTLVSIWADKYAPSANIIVTGHTHHAGIWHRNNKIIINTGCFGFPSHPRAVEINNEKITVFKVIKKKDTYALGRVCASLNAL
jgi:predicted phosphodiesterase